MKIPSSNVIASIPCFRCYLGFGVFPYHLLTPDNTPFTQKCGVPNPSLAQYKFINIDRAAAFHTSCSCPSRVHMRAPAAKGL